MKSFGIFVLTKAEQRVVVVIVLTLLATAIVRRYRIEPSQVVPAISTTVPNQTASPPSNWTDADSLDSDNSP